MIILAIQKWTAPLILELWVYKKRQYMDTRKGWFWNRSVFYNRSNKDLSVLLFSYFRKVYSRPVKTRPYNISQIADQFVEASGDFKQFHENVDGGNVKGHKLKDGRFIFIWENNNFKKMVLTDNQGVNLKSGYLLATSESWENPDSWTTTERYAIYNFKGVKIQGWYTRFFIRKFIYHGEGTMAIHAMCYTKIFFCVTCNITIIIALLNFIR